MEREISYSRARSTRESSEVLGFFLLFPFFFGGAISDFYECDLRANLAFEEDDGNFLIFSPIFWGTGASRVRSTRAGARGIHVAPMGATR